MCLINCKHLADLVAWILCNTWFPWLLQLQLNSHLFNSLDYISFYKKNKESDGQLMYLMMLPLFACLFYYVFISSFCILRNSTVALFRTHRNGMRWKERESSPPTSGSRRAIQLSGVSHGVPTASAGPLVLSATFRTVTAMWTVIGSEFLGINVFCHR